MFLLLTTILITFSYSKESTLAGLVSIYLSLRHTCCVISTVLRRGHYIFFGIRYVILWAAW